MRDLHLMLRFWSIALFWALAFNDLVASAQVPSALANSSWHDDKDGYCKSVSFDGSTCAGTAALRDAGCCWSGPVSFRWTRGTRVDTALWWSTHAEAISSDGSTIVMSFGEQRANWNRQKVCVTSLRYGTRFLGSLPGAFGNFPKGISEDGSVVVGTCTYMEERDRAYRWSVDTGMHDLGLLPECDDARPVGVSLDGSVVAGYCSALPPYGPGRPGLRAFRWTTQGGMKDLGAPSTVANMRTIAVSGDGSTVIGAADRWDGDPVPFVWRAETGVKLIGVDPTWLLPEVVAVSADGSVVVGSFLVELDGDFENRAFRWTASGGCVNLGPAPDGTETRAVDVSADGRAILIAGGASGTCRWTSIGGFEPLDYTPTGSRVSEPYRISGDGSVIVGTLPTGIAGNAPFRAQFPPLPAIPLAPRITGTTPTAGPLAGGTVVTVTGANFVSGATTVKVGGVSATNITVTGSSSLTAITPAGTVGAKAVSVTTVGGTATKAGGFTYVGSPTVTTVTPSTGPAAGGTTITIAGTNLAGATVTVGGVAATAVVSTATSVTAKTPAGTAGARDVVVTAPGGVATKAGGFTYLPAPTIASVGPNAGPLGGGTVITITGTNLSGATVKVGGVVAAVSSTSATSVTAKTPAGTAGARDVVVTAPGGVVTGVGAFTYVALPTVTSVSPSAGPLGGGTVITITGTNLSGATVKVGGVVAAVSSTSATSVTATTPPGTVGAKAVSVTTVGGTATKANAFTYTATIAGDAGSMPAGGGSIGVGGTARAEEPADPALPVTRQRCVLLLLQSGVVLPECTGTPCDDLPQVTLDPVVEGPEGPDLDGNGVPDLCQLRCGDLDMNGVIDSGDVAELLSMMGEEPVLGIGDLDGDGVIEAEDAAKLLELCSTP